MFRHNRSRTFVGYVKILRPLQKLDRRTQEIKIQLGKKKIKTKNHIQLIKNLKSYHFKTFLINFEYGKSNFNY